MIPAARAPHRRWSYLGLALIGLALVGLREGPQFPGWQASLPVVGTVLVLRHGKGGLLVSAPLELIGRASYSLYLCHWPVFSFIDYRFILQSPELRLVLKLILTAGCTVVSYRCVERPLRVWLNRTPSRRLAYATLAFILIALGPLGYALRNQHYIDGSDGRFFEARDSKGTIVLIGDSQATVYGELLRDLARAHQHRLVILCQAGKDPVMNGALWESTLREIERVRPTQLVLACHWDKLGRDPNRLKATLERLKPLVSRQIILMTMPPDRPKNASREAIRAGARPPFYEAPDKRAFRQQLDRLAKDLADAKVQVLETAPFFVDADGSVPVFNEAGQPLFFDRLHLSKVGTDRLKPTLTRMLTQRP